MTTPNKAIFDTVSLHYVTISVLIKLYSELSDIDKILESELQEVSNTHAKVAVDKLNKFMIFGDN